MKITPIEEMGYNPIAELVGEIEYLNDEYRKGSPVVTDHIYDEKLERLRVLDPQNHNRIY